MFAPPSPQVAANQWQDVTPKAGGFPISLAPQAPVYLAPERVSGSLGAASRVHVSRRLSATGRASPNIRNNRRPRNLKDEHVYINITWL
jgi:hypothetical protein